MGKELSSLAFFRAGLFMAVTPTVEIQVEEREVIAVCGHLFVVKEGREVTEASMMLPESSPVIIHVYECTAKRVSK